MFTTPALAGVASLPDVTATTSPAALGSLPAGSSGILVTAHPSNGGTIVRVSGPDVASGQGQPLGAGASYLFGVPNASRLSVCTESGSGTVCVSAA